MITREQWLEQAIEEIRPWFAAIEYPLPDRVHVSVGFAYGAKRENAQVLGQCWRAGASADGINQIFVSPEIGDTYDVMETLLHELVHAVDDCESGHKGRYAEIATALGLRKPMTYTPASPEVQAELITIAAALGDYPHGKINTGSTVTVTKGKQHSGPAKQGTYLRKVVCACCGYTARVTGKWLDQGMPKCPQGTDMEVAA